MASYAETGRKRPECRDECLSEWRDEHGAAPVAQVLISS